MMEIKGFMLKLNIPCHEIGFTTGDDFYAE